MAAVPSLLKSAIKWGANGDTITISTLNSKPSCSSLEDISVGVIYVVVAIISNDNNQRYSEMWEQISPMGQENIRANGKQPLNHFQQVIHTTKR